MDPHDFCTAERLVIPLRKILLIGTLGSVKTTLAEYLAQVTGFPYASIDACRIRYEDNTIAGEDCAWDHFLEICGRPTPGILEFSGMGPHVDEVRDALRGSGIPVTIIWLLLPLDVCITRAMQRKKSVPAPYQWAPIENAVPAIHDAIEYSWERTWCREEGFHAVRQEFRETASVAEIYSGIKRDLFGIMKDIE